MSIMNIVIRDAVFFFSFPSNELRAPSDERVHDAVVPDSVLDVPAAGDGAQGLGPHPARGKRGAAQDGARHLEEARRVSDEQLNVLKM